MSLFNILADSSVHHVDPIGMLGMALGVTASVMRGRLAILLTGAAAGTCFGVHYLGLGSWTGAALCMVSVGQNLSSARFAADGPPLWLTGAFLASAILALALAATTWSGWPSACAAAGMVFSTVARLQVEPNRMRALFLVSTSFWCVHDLGIGSVPGIATQILTLAGFLSAMAMSGTRTRVAPPLGITARRVRRPGALVRRLRDRAVPNSGAGPRRVPAIRVRG